MINVMSILKDSDHKCLLAEGSGGWYLSGTLKCEDFIEKMRLEQRQRRRVPSGWESIPAMLKAEAIAPSTGAKGCLKKS